ncbi:MAG: alpha-L-arabinofuranosidase [Bacteroidetes bacterium]|nr:alpha-L-arabinofuranosidase [Bacteroidota bacterium]
MKNLPTLSMLLLLASAAFYACKKQNNGNQDNNNNNNGLVTIGNTPGTITKGTDPQAAAAQGFFLTDSWQAKTFTIPSNAATASKPAASDITVTIDLSQIITKVSPYIFGNNTNPFMGQFVDQPVLMSNLTTLSPNILRFPGGSLSDIYFWNAGDGQAPADAPAQLLDANGNASNAGYWFGNNPAAWTLTLDNYYKVLQQTNSTGLITVNYGYARYGTSAHPDQAAAHLAAQWVRYDKGRTKYWEIGNEIYGNWEAGYRINTATNQDGQPPIITPALYGTHFKVFADSMRAAAKETGAAIQIGIVLTGDNSGSSSGNVDNWNAGVLAAVGNTPDFYVVHNYYTPYNQNSSPDAILATPASGTASMINWVRSSVAGAGVTQKPVAMDEYNIFATGSNQRVSQIAGMHGVMVLGEALKNQISMVSRWDLANGWDNGNDMGMFNNSSQNGGSEPGAPAWNARPAFYYMYYFQKYFGDRMVYSSVTGSSTIYSYASMFSSGQAGDILVNTSSGDQTVSLAIDNFIPGAKYYYYVLTGGTDGTFSRKVLVNGNGPSGNSGGPSNFLSIPPVSVPQKGGINITIPAYGVVYLVADGSI